MASVCEMLARAGDGSLYASTAPARAPEEYHDMGADAARRRIRDDEILERYPIDVDPIYGCWLWVGKTDDEGYARERGSVRVMHRVIYEELCGAIGAGMELDHLCRRKGCVRPEHMEQVTRQQNEARKRWTHRLGCSHRACPRGHSSWEYGRLTPEGGRVCLVCSGLATERASASVTQIDPRLRHAIDFRSMRDLCSKRSDAPKGAKVTRARSEKGDDDGMHDEGGREVDGDPIGAHEAGEKAHVERRCADQACDEGRHEEKEVAIFAPKGATLQKEQR